MVDTAYTNNDDKRKRRPSTDPLAPDKPQGSLADRLKAIDQEFQAPSSGDDYSPEAVSRRLAQAQTPKPAPPPAEPSLLDDLGALGKAGGVELARAVADVTGNEEVAANLADQAAAYREGLSPAQQEAMQSQYLGEGEQSAFSSPGRALRKVAGDIAQSGAPTLVGMGAGLAGAAALAPAIAGGAAATVAGGALRGTALKAAQWLSTRPGAATLGGAVSGGVAEGTVAGVMASTAIKDRVNAMSPEQIAQSPLYQEAIAAGSSPEQAKKQLLDTISSQTGWRTGALVGLLGAPAGALFGRAIVGRAGFPGARGRLGAAMVAGGAEGTQELSQSAGEQVLSNLAIQQAIDPTQSLTEGVGEAAVAGGIAGAAMGAPLGFIAGPRRQPTPATPPETSPTPEQTAADTQPPPGFVGPPTQAQRTAQQNEAARRRNLAGGGVAGEQAPSERRKLRQKTAGKSPFTKKKKGESDEKYAQRVNAAYQEWVKDAGEQAKPIQADRRAIAAARKTAGTQAAYEAWESAITRAKEATGDSAALEAWESALEQAGKPEYQQARKDKAIERQAKRTAGEQSALEVWESAIANSHRFPTPKAWMDDYIARRDAAAAKGEQVGRLDAKVKADVRKAYEEYKAKGGRTRGERERAKDQLRKRLEAATRATVEATAAPPAAKPPDTPRQAQLRRFMRGGSARLLEGEGKAVSKAPVFNAKQLAEVSDQTVEGEFISRQEAQAGFVGPTKPKHTPYTIDLGQVKARPNAVATAVNQIESDLAKGGLSPEQITALQDRSNRMRKAHAAWAREYPTEAKNAKSLVRAEKGDSGRGRVGGKGRTDMEQPPSPQPGGQPPQGPSGQGGQGQTRKGADRGDAPSTTPEGLKGYPTTKAYSRRAKSTTTRLQKGDIVTKSLKPWKQEAGANNVLTKSGADPAKWRVVPAGGGYVIRAAPTAEEAQAEKAKAKPKAKAKAKVAVDPAKDDLLAAIAKQGGLSRDEAEAQGIDPAEFQRQSAGILYVFKKEGGRSFDEMAETLSQDNYPVLDEGGTYSANALLESLSQALAGKKIMAGPGLEKEAAKQAEGREDDQAQRDEDYRNALRDKLEQLDTHATTDDRKTIVSAIREDLESGKVDLQEVDETIDEALVLWAPDEFALTATTPEELRRLDEQAKAEAKAEQEASQKAKADEGVAEFGLEPEGRDNAAVANKMDDLLDETQVEPKFSAQTAKRIAARNRISRQAAERAIDTFQQRYRGTPGITFRVANTAEEAFGEAAEGKGRIKGGIDQNGNVTVVLENLESPADVQAVLRHEVIAHYGLPALLGNEYADLLSKVIDSADTSSGMRKVWQSVEKDYPALSKTQQAEEVLARAAEESALKLTIRSWYAKVKQLLRKVGLLPANAVVGRAEIAELLRSSMRRLSAAAPQPQTGRAPAIKGVATTPKAAAQRLDNILSERRVDGQPAIRFSTQASDPAGAGSILGNMGQSLQNMPLVDRIIQGISNKTSDWRPLWLKSLTRQQIVEIGQSILPRAQTFEEKARKMEADANKEAELAAEIANDWALKISPFASRADREAFRQMALLGHDATLVNIDPAEPIHANATASEKAMYDELRQRWDNDLNDAARDKYRTVRDKYRERSKQIYEALVERIERSDASKKEKRKAINELRKKFESSKMRVYFPLARFGDYFIVAEKQGEPKQYMLFETRSEQRRNMVALDAAGYKIKHGKKLKSLIEAMGPSADQMRQIVELAAGDKAMQDNMWQLYLRWLPEGSIRKHYVHRKGIAGFSDDALRAFANNMAHGAKQLARIRYGDQLADDIAGLRKDAADASDPEKAADIVNELDRNYQWMMNPSMSNWAGNLTSLGFFFYLGLSPAAALVNMTQIPIITYPYLATRYGKVAAAAELTRSLKDYGATTRWFGGKAQGNRQRIKLEGEFNGDMGKALREYEESGAVSRTQTMSLMGLGEGQGAPSRAKEKAMQGVGYLFHQAEVANRVSTAVAAYRLQRRRLHDDVVAGRMTAAESHKSATQAGYDAIFKTHYDYSAANRAAFMRSDAARVLLLFRQYSQNTTFRLWRDFYQMFKGETAEAKKEARGQFLGIMGMTALFSGATGLPMMAAATAIAQLAHDLWGDDEEWDADLALRQTLKEWTGPNVGAAIARGPVSQLTGVDIATRTKMTDMWFRSPNQHMEGRSEGQYWLEQAAGPVVGMGLNLFPAYQMMRDGHLGRGIETMMPKWWKDIQKAVRFTNEGARSLAGDPLVEEFNPLEIMMQASGFAPFKLSEIYQERGEIKKIEQRILSRRRRLLNKYAYGLIMRERGEAKEALADIRQFNKTYPQAPISAETLESSIGARMRAKQWKLHGQRIDPKLYPTLRKQRYLE